jgi:hypothetical protein
MSMMFLLLNFPAFEGGNILLTNACTSFISTIFFVFVCTKGLFNK